MIKDAVRDHARTFLSTLISRLPRGVLTDERFFDLYQSKGWHALPIEYYGPVPNTAELPSELWAQPSSLVGIDLRLAQQRAFLSEVAPPFLDEYHRIPATPPTRDSEYTRGAGFNGIDGALLYTMIRAHKPRRVIEIGSGFSTLLSLLALRRNVDETGQRLGALTAIEPYPREFLHEALAGSGQLVVSKVEDVPLSVFETLEANDILFIDSSHTVRIGGDVLYEILEIVPRLKPGVLVHFHDIFLPCHYPETWVKKRRVFWTEQYLLQAFLTFNRDFEVRWGASAMHVSCPADLKRAFPDFDPSRQDAGSFWIQRVR